GTASGLINTARMIGATLGVAVLGAVFAMHVAEGVGTWGLATAYFGGGIGELIGAAVAVAFIRCDSLRPPPQNFPPRPQDSSGSNFSLGPQRSYNRDPRRRTASPATL